MNPVSIIRNDIAEQIEAVGYCFNVPKFTMDIIDAVDALLVPRTGLAVGDMRNPYHDLEPLLMRDSLEDGDTSTVRSAFLFLHDLCFYASIPFSLVTTLPCMIAANIIRGE